MADITIQLSLLPESLRPHKVSGGAPAAKDRYIDDNMELAFLETEGRFTMVCLCMSGAHLLVVRDWGEPEQIKYIDGGVVRFHMTKAR